MLNDAILATFLLAQHFVFLERFARPMLLAYNKQYITLYDNKLLLYNTYNNIDEKKRARNKNIFKMFELQN